MDVHAAICAPSAPSADPRMGPTRKPLSTRQDVHCGRQRSVSSRPRPIGAPVRNPSLRRVYPDRLVKVCTGPAGARMLSDASTCWEIVLRLSSRCQ